MSEASIDPIPSTSTARRPMRSDPWLAVALTLALVAAWMLLHAYVGIRQDAVEYAMQGLAHAHPELWMRDIYLRFGSQDNFTIFAALYARVILWLGLEPAARLLTLLSQVGFFLAAWRLARRLTPPNCVVLGLGLLITLPAGYGGFGLFHIAEDMLTPRLAAEAFVLCGLLAWLREQRWLAALCLVLALALHPIMAVAGLVYWLWVTVGFPRPWLTIGLVGIGLLALVSVGLGASGPPWRFDELWFSLGPGRVPFVLVGHWSAIDWAVNLAPLSALSVAGILIDTPTLRRLVLAALATGLSGLALAWIGGDWLHLVLIVQGQPWRWLWLSTVVATLTLPFSCVLLWQRGRLGRATAALLAAEYLLMHESFGAWLIPLTFGALALSQYARAHLLPRAQGLVLLGAALVLAVAIVIEFLGYYINARVGYFPTEAYSMPMWMKQLRGASLYALFIPIVLVLVTWLAQSLEQRSMLLLLSVVLVVLIGAEAPAVWAQWEHQNFTAEDKAEFASWRSRIPPNSEVLYTPNPLLSWVLLERPSYISDAQSASVLFSRPAAMAFLERAVPLKDFLVAEDVTHMNSELKTTEREPTLAAVCEAAPVRFVVSHNDLQATPVDEIPASFHRPYGGLKLYQCTEPPTTNALPTK
jgi:hypothetical protein